jgi:acyl-CoA synthetase
MPGDRAIDWIERSGATYVMGVPTHALDVLSAARERELKRLYGVNTFYMAGAPIPVEVARQLMELGAKPQNIYGMTENGSHQYTRPEDDLETITGTCGRACRSYEVKLWSQENRDVEVTASGRYADARLFRRSDRHRGFIQCLGLVHER